MHNVRDLVCTPWDAGFRNSIHSLPLTNHSPSLSCAKRNVAQGYGPPSCLLLLPASLHPSSGMTSCTSVVPTGCPSHGQPNDKLLFFTSSPVLPPHPTLCFLCAASLSESLIGRDKLGEKQLLLFLAWPACIGMYVMTMRNSIH